ncbi:MAG TPA: GDP-L-fucose synthase [bacterium]|nr:GDP-L-fucose synthase [bacterium]HQI50366.1 GDP-L-fucose synthase [bacterium]HQJ65443.1 GDP-L-fucose synthase [bacterium]
MKKDSKVYIAGHKGMVGSALVRTLEAKGYRRLLVRTLEELDILDQAAVFKFMAAEKPDFVFIAAAKVGGILANNTFRAQFIYENLQIQANLIHAAHLSGVQKLLFLGSSCIYPKLAPQPIREEHLLTGPLESTNEPYAIAKIAGIKMCEAYRAQYGSNFISVMPTNLYGPNDNFDLQTSHVLPALIRRFHEAKDGNQPSVTIWGTGKPRREFLHVDDLADSCVFLMNKYDRDEILNIGVGEDLTIRELAELIKGVVGYAGGIEFDTSKPDGTPRKLLDVSRLRATGWRPRIGLEEGIRRTYAWYLENRVKR